MVLKNNISALKLGLIAIAMFGFGYALVPIYNMLCDVTGLNGGSKNLSEAQEVNFIADESRMVTVEFVTNLNQGMQWEFKPEVSKMKVHPGKSYQANFFVSNNTNRAITGQAIPKVAPNTASNHFVKTECFCFNNQTLQAGESMQMPVVFVINPELPERVKTVTLSYTFFDISQTVELKTN